MPAETTSLPTRAANAAPFDRNWHAAMILLDAPFLRRRVGDYIDEAALRIHADILDCGWSSGQRRLIELAVSLTNSDHAVNLHGAFDNLDDSTIRRVSRALQIAIGGSRNVELLR